MATELFEEQFILGDGEDYHRNFQRTFLTKLDINLLQPLAFITTYQTETKWNNQISLCLSNHRPDIAFMYPATISFLPSRKKK